MLFVLTKPELLFDRLLLFMNELNPFIKNTTKPIWLPSIISIGMY